MRIETAPLTYPPYECVVTGREDGEMCDFETDLLYPQEPGHLYIKRDVVEAAARELGMVSASEVEPLREQLADLSTKLDDALENVAVVKAFEDKFNPERTPSHV